MVDIQKDAVAEETQKELQSMGVDVKFVTGDASSEDVIKEAVKVCVDNWGKIDILANIAGVSYMRRGLEDTTVEQWDKVNGD
ncbi:MAG: SDR family NAD(P)-dependent oxidoreductase [Anaerobutyricum sp.]